MARVCSVVGALGIVFVGFVTAASAQQSSDLAGVLLLNGKGYARGQADVTISLKVGDKFTEPITVTAAVCAEGAQGEEQACKLEADGNAATRANMWQFELPPDSTLVGWATRLTVQSSTESQECSAAGTTLPAQVSCGPTAGKQTVRFHLTGGGQ